MENIEQYHLKFGDVSHNLKQRGRKAFTSCCFPGHNLHVGARVLQTPAAISVFPSNNFFFQFRRIICTIFLCNKRCRSPCSFKRKGPSHLFNCTSVSYRELVLRERKDGCFCTFSNFNTFAQLSFPSLPQISTFFSQPCLSKTPIFPRASFPARKATIIFC